MSRQRPVSDDSDTVIELEDWVPEDGLDESLADATIYQKESINPAKRRRLEAMREERELLKDIRDVFDDYDFDD
ncbi:hypothetical protein [Neptuniibacter halophilus]|uniref:hypothetical protein n=1 Tax=Neptuniibacter halophilus TaxID=651666 RepID=UPI002572C724|nr:hypothetical protein [Neptuniibacter halophilus]